MSEILKELFGITLRMPSGPQNRSLTVNRIESAPGAYQIITDIIYDGGESERICFGANSENFGEKLARLKSVLPFDCYLRQSGCGNGTSYYYFE